MSAASFKLSTTSFQLSLNTKLYVQYNYENQFQIYLEKIDHGVRPKNNYRLRHLTPLTLEELIQLTEASKILHSTLQYNHYLLQKQKISDE